MPTEEDRHPWQGRLYVLYHIACAGCAAEDEVGSSLKRVTQGLATSVFRLRGWGIRRRLWYCPNCLDESESLAERP